MPFAATWMNPEGTVLGEVSQRKTNTIRYHLYVESKKKSQTQEKQTQSSIYQGLGVREMVRSWSKGTNFQLKD